MPARLTHVLLALLPLILVLVLMTLEVIVYLMRTGWYYRTGPTVSRRQWHAAPPAAHTCAAIEQVLAGSK